LPMMKRTLTISLDTDWFWRVMFKKIWQVLSGAVVSVTVEIVGYIDLGKQSVGRFLARYFAFENNGAMARAWPIGVTGLWIAVLLSAYIFTYYI